MTPSEGSHVFRIAFVYDRMYPYTLGGAERYYDTLARALDGRCQVTYVTRRYWARGTKPSAGLDVLGLGRPPGRLAMRWPGLRYLAKTSFGVRVFLHVAVRGGRYDVIHTASTPISTVVAVAAGLRLRAQKALVVDWHEVISVESWTGRLSWLGRVVYGIQRRTVRVGRAAVTFSQLHADRLRAIDGGVQLSIVPEFLPWDVRSVDHAPRPREKTIVYAGRLAREKRVHLIPAVLAELNRQDAPWTAVIFGGGDERERIRVEAEHWGVSNSLKLRGFAAWDELAHCMASSTALIFPSEREGFGLVVLEASAHGLPSVLVAAPDNAAVELISPGENGFVCASSDPLEMAAAVLAVAADKGFSERTVRWFRRHEPTYNVESTVEHLTDLYDRIGVKHHVSVLENG